MKQLLPIILLLLTFIPDISSAQSISLGTRHGVGITQLYPTGNGFARDFVINQEFVTGYTGGVLMQHFANRTIGFQGGLFYAGKGWTQVLSNGQKFTTNLNYLDLEALAQLQFGRGNFKFFLQGGPFGSYLLSSSDNLSAISDESLIRYNYDSDVDNKLNYGIKGGGGFLLKTNVGTFQLQGLYGQTLGNLIDTSTTTRALYTQLQTFEVSATYLIPLFSEM